MRNTKLMMRYFFFVIMTLCVYSSTLSSQEKIRLGSGYSGWNKNPVISHRGAWKNTGNPQNSLASFRDAARMGCHGSECDVRFSKEDSLVIFHDGRRNGKLIEETPFSELRATRLSNGEVMPTLREYITEAMKQKKTKLIIDIKTLSNDKQRTVELARAVNSLVVEMGAEAWVEYLVGYVPAGVALVETTDLPVAYLGQWMQDDPDAAPERISSIGLRCVDFQDQQYHRHPEWIPVFKRMKTHLNVWTVNEEQEMIYFLTQGFNYITSDEPERLLKVYGSDKKKYRKAMRDSTRGL